MIVNKSQSPLLNYNIVRDWSKEAGDHTAELGALLQRVFVLISALGKGEKAISLPAAGLYSEVLTEWMKGWNIGHPACTGGSCSIQDRETAPSDNRDLPTIADALRGHPTPPREMPSWHSSQSCLLSSHLPVFQNSQYSLQNLKCSIQDCTLQISQFRGHMFESQTSKLTDETETLELAG